MLSSDDVDTKDDPCPIHQPVQLEAFTPRDCTLGFNMTIYYGTCNSWLGDIFLAATEQGICNLSFMDRPDQTQHLERLSKLWPAATLLQSCPPQVELVRDMFAGNDHLSKPISVHVRGTDFQVKVWRALLKIHSGYLSSYGQLAKYIGNPKAARAVGSAVAANPVALFIPCHRVIRQGGDIGGYRWGLQRKRKLLSWEKSGRKNHTL